MERLDSIPPVANLQQGLLYTKVGEIITIKTNDDPVKRSQIKIKLKKMFIFGVNYALMHDVVLKQHNSHCGSYIHRYHFIIFFKGVDLPYAAPSRIYLD